MYMRFENGLLYTAEEPTEGYKPVTMTQPPEAPTGYHAAYYWKEETAAFVQTWEVVEDVDEVDDAEALNILLGVEE